VVAALRDAGTLAYSELRERSGVPLGSFDRTLTALVRDGTVLKGSDGYRLADDGSTIKSQETRAGSGGFVYCARCEGSHPSPDKRRGETFEDVHRRAIAP
jgi:DNA-binding IscR family transcriptional regulator